MKPTGRLSYGGPDLQALAEAREAKAEQARRYHEEQELRKQQAANYVVRFDEYNYRSYNQAPNPSLQRIVQSGNVGTYFDGVDISKLLKDFSWTGTQQPAPTKVEGHVALKELIEQLSAPTDEPGSEDYEEGFRACLDLVEAFAEAINRGEKPWE
jgi:hypothetical protein